MDESVVRVFEEQKVGTLRLSDAIRIGAKLHPQGHSALYENGKTCALGAAFVATFGRVPAPIGAAEPDYMRLYATYPALRKLKRDIWNRNDGYGWTREQIADWVEAQGY